MKHVEAEGSTIDEAIDRALAELGVARDKAEIEILQNTTRGLFGLGGRKARVRASLRRQINLDENDRTTGEPERILPLEHALSESEGVELEPSAGDREASQKTGLEEGATLQRARDVLEEIVSLMHVEVQVTIANGGSLVVNGDKKGVLIGRRGQTLDALEYLINRIIAREEHEGRVTIDAAQYRERRRESLEALARRLADRVRRRGKSVSLNPMSPRDRRIIHLALHGDSTLVTRSTGDGYYRRLVIAPSRARGGRQRPRREERETQEGDS